MESDNNGVVIVSASLNNFAGFEKFKCAFGDSVTYIYANNGGGKTTVGKTCLEAAINGIAEQSGYLKAQRFQFIGRYGKSADVELEFHDKDENRNFFIKNVIKKNGNNITFRAGDKKPISDRWLKNFLNVSLMSANEFCKLSGKEQAVALGIDTSTFDDRIAELKEERKYINKAIKAIGVIEEVEEVKPVSITELLVKKKEVTRKLNEQYKANREANQKLKKEYDDAIFAWNNEKETISSLVNNLSALQNAGYQGMEVAEFIGKLKKENVKPVEPTYVEEMPDGTENDILDKQISEAEATNLMATNYQKYVENSDKLTAKNTELEKIESQIKEEQEALVTYINHKDFGFKGLTTSENGELLFKERPLREPYFSRGELELIVARLAASLNPVFKYRFIDEFGVLDPDNQKKIVDQLLKEGFQVVVAIPGEEVKHDNSLVLRQCKLVDGKEEEGEELL